MTANPDTSTNTTRPDTSSSRHRILEAATRLLASGGREAVTTRAVATAAGVHPPLIYRLFGDKDGLLDAVAKHGHATYFATKGTQVVHDDPVDDLRAGWDAAVAFGLDNPELYVLMYGEPQRRPDSNALQAGMEQLLDKIIRVAAAGRLRLDETLAAHVIHATARGAVLTWLSTPDDDRDPSLLATLRESMVAAVTYEDPVIPDPGLAAAARTVRALLPVQSPLTATEHQLLIDWLDRLT